jgi:hypothetical protein
MYADKAQKNQSSFTRGEPMKGAGMYGHIIVPPLVLMLLFLGCAGVGKGTLEERYGKNRPVITRSFAAKEMRLGETWKIYLTASDADGDLRYIVATLDQPGKGGAYPPSYIRIRNSGRDLSGYVYLPTDVNVDQGLLYANIILTVSVADKAGHFSDPVSFPLHFRHTGAQEPPPAGAFQENELGPVMIRVQPLGDSGDIGT